MFHFIAMHCVFKLKACSVGFFIFVNKDSTVTCYYAGFDHEKQLQKSCERTFRFFSVHHFRYNNIYGSSWRSLVNDAIFLLLI